MSDQKSTTRNPWAWIPTLYFTQGIPYVMVMTVSVIMYKKLGISNTDIALYTSWLYLPWVIKPLWSPLIDIFKTKRFWIISMQLFIGAALASIALTIPAPSFFQYTIAIFWLMAFSSSTHDIAADGFYMLALPTEKQAAFVGVRSTFYRVAMVTGQGILVILAGYIESHSGLSPVEIEMAANPSKGAHAYVMVDSTYSPADSLGELRILPSKKSFTIEANSISKPEWDSILAWAKNRNLDYGYTERESLIKVEKSWWQEKVSDPLGSFLTEVFHPGKKDLNFAKGNLAIISFRLSKQLKEGSQIIFTFAHESGDKDFSLLEGERLVFTSENWNKSALAVIEIDPKLSTKSKAVFVGRSGDIPLSWSITFFILAGLFILLFIYHKFILPYPLNDKSTLKEGSKNIFKEFVHTFVLFFKRKNIGVILAFLLLFRFAEAQLVKLVSPFLLDFREIGGLGLSTSEVGIVYGTIGIISLTIGGLLGGYAISKKGLRWWLWPMVIIMHAPDLAFVYLSHYQPTNFVLINAAVAFEQFGYGFGFTAYMMFMIMISQGEHKTAHYAICTGIMALGMMLPGMFSGWLQDHIGYNNFFIWVVISTIPGFIVAGLVKIDPEFGKKKEEPVKV
jgi:PAT family beta-lactamase induction signal transducer AmpG